MGWDEKKGVFVGKMGVMERRRGVGEWGVVGDVMVVALGEQ